MKKKPARYNIRHIKSLADYFGMRPKVFLPEKTFPANIPEKDKKVVKKKGRDEVHN